MGRVTRWFKGLFGIKTTKVNVRNEYPGDHKSNNTRQHHDAAAQLCNNPATVPPNITSAEAAWLRSFFDNETDREQSKHAIAVAAATAAAADAAVAAAQAAVAVVRLTNQQGRGGSGGVVVGSNNYGNTTTTTASFGGRGKFLAALKIQAVFRGFLARKALRALKGLVKIQALVRGFLVRKQAAATLYSMQALIRAQASVRAQRNRSFITNYDNKEDLTFLTQHLARNSMEKHEDAKSSHEQQHLSSSHSKRLSASLEPPTIISNTPILDQDSPKIVEVDRGSKARISKSRRTNSESFDAESLTIPPQQSRLLIPDEQEDNCYWGEEQQHCHCYTTQSTPRMATNCGFEHGFTTPSKSVCFDGYGRNCGVDKLFYPNYMAKTLSFKAKLRSHSAPRQRPEGGFSKRRLSLHEMMESRNSLRLEERSCSRVQEAVAFKNAVMGKINGRSSNFFPGS